MHGAENLWCKVIIHASACNHFIPVKVFADRGRLEFSGRGSWKLIISYTIPVSLWRNVVPRRHMWWYGNIFLLSTRFPTSILENRMTPHWGSHLSLWPISWGDHVWRARESIHLPCRAPFRSNLQSLGHLLRFFDSISYFLSIPRLPSILRLDKAW